MTRRRKPQRSYLVRFVPVDPRLTEEERLARVNAPGGCHHDFWSDLVVTELPPEPHES